MKMNFTKNKFLLTSKILVAQVRSTWWKLIATATSTTSSWRRSKIWYNTKHNVPT